MVRIPEDAEGEITDALEDKDGQIVTQDDGNVEFDAQYAAVVVMERINSWRASTGDGQAEPLPRRTSDPGYDAGTWADDLAAMQARINAALKVIERHAAVNSHRAIWRSYYGGFMRDVRAALTGEQDGGDDRG
jgi:hypothetical protein